MERIRPGDIVIFRNQKTCLVVSVHELPGMGTFYDVLFSDGQSFLVDRSDLSVM